MEAPKLVGIREDAFMATPPLRSSGGFKGDEARGIRVKEDPGGRNLVAGPGTYSAVDPGRRDAILIFLVAILIMHTRFSHYVCAPRVELFMYARHLA